jgi:type II secretory pathway pseudopilin PulG
MDPLYPSLPLRVTQEGSKPVSSFPFTVSGYKAHRLRKGLKTSFTPSLLRPLNRKLETANWKHSRCAAFTLIELLVVVTIIIVLAGLSLPSLTGIAGSTGRKGAVNVLLNTFEQARAVALENSVNTYIGFADANFPEETLRYRAFIVFRDRTEDDVPAVGAIGATDYVALTKWETLPRTISIKSETQSVVGDFYLTLNDTSLPRVPSGTSIPVLAFNSTGAIQSSHTTAKLRLFIYEGYYLNNQDNFSRQKGFHQSASGLFERISFSRFTGRAQLDVTTVQ